jgi:hypothetical protein
MLHDSLSSLLPEIAFVSYVHVGTLFNCVNETVSMLVTWLDTQRAVECVQRVQIHTPEFHLSFCSGSKPINSL